MKILLLCNAGMSTSMLVAQMRKIADDADEINAASLSSADDIVKDYDVVLLGPQVRYSLDKIKELLAGTDTPVDVISPIVYGAMNASAVLTQAHSLIVKR